MYSNSIVWAVKCMLNHRAINTAVALMVIFDLINLHVSPCIDLCHKQSNKCFRVTHPVRIRGGDSKSPEPPPLWPRGIQKKTANNTLEYTSGHLHSCNFSCWGTLHITIVISKLGHYRAGTVTVTKIHRQGNSPSILIRKPSHRRGFQALRVVDLAG